MHFNLERRTTAIAVPVHKIVSFSSTNTDRVISYYLVSKSTIVDLEFGT